MIEDDDESPLNKDFYTNLKAQAWWQLRLRFERTHRAVTQGVQVRSGRADFVAIDVFAVAHAAEGIIQPTMSKGTRMKLVIDKQPEGTMSPNLADAVVMAYWPVDSYGVQFKF